MLDGASNQPSKFGTKNWIEINDEPRETYNVNSQIKFKTKMLRSSLCDYSDACILVEGKIKIAGEELMMQLHEQIKEIKVWHLKIVPHSLIAPAK